MLVSQWKFSQYVPLCIYGATLADFIQCYNHDNG